MQAGNESMYIIKQQTRLILKYTKLNYIATITQKQSTQTICKYYSRKLKGVLAPRMDILVVLLTTSIRKNSWPKLFK